MTSSMCDSANNQQAMRARLFMRWFERYDAKKDYIIRSTTMQTEDQEDFITMIVPRRHPSAVHWRHTPTTKIWATGGSVLLLRSPMFVGALLRSFIP